jgi:hypothetical protein
MIESLTRWQIIQNPLDRHRLRQNRLQNLCRQIRRRWHHDVIEDFCTRLRNADSIPDVNTTLFVGLNRKLSHRHQRNGHQGKPMVHYFVSQWHVLPFILGHKPPLPGPEHPQSMHSLAARGRGTWAGEAAVSAKARVPMQIEYRVGFMFPSISCSFEHLCEDAHFLIPTLCSQKRRASVVPP